MLLRLAAAAELPAADAVDAGREAGTDAARRAPAGTCAEVLTAELAALGFDPESLVDDDGATIAFTRCPFRELAESQPRPRVQPPPRPGRGIHRRPRRCPVVEFHDLADRTPCQVEIATVAR